MLKSVIIGTAHMHVNEIALYIDGQPDTELCGIADVSSNIEENTDKKYTRMWNIENIKNTYRIKEYDNFENMLDEICPDVAYVLCENSQKLDVARKIAKRGVDIILEKPMALNFEEAKQIAYLKEKYGVQILINWPVAWRKYLYEMKLAIDSKTCGELQKIRYINGHTGPLGKGAKHRGVATNADEMTDEERKRIWWYRSECGGGAYMDILCYGCYFARWMFGGNPDDIFTVGQNLNTHFGDIEDNVEAIMRYDNGVVIAEGTWTTPRRRMTTGPEAICSDGVVWCDGTPDSEAFVRAIDMYGNDLDVPELADDNRFKNMPWHYAAFKLGGASIHETLTLEFNLDVMRMLDAARRSNLSRKAEKLYE